MFQNLISDQQGPTVAQVCMRGRRPEPSSSRQYDPDDIDLLSLNLEPALNSVLSSRSLYMRHVYEMRDGISEGPYQCLLKMPFIHEQQHRRP
jgi:hypothetical protein